LQGTLSSLYSLNLAQECQNPNVKIYIAPYTRLEQAQSAVSYLSKTGLERVGLSWSANYLSKTQTGNADGRTPTAFSLFSLFVHVDILVYLNSDMD